MNKKGTNFQVILVMICTTGSRLLGFLRIAVISFIFGAGGQVDVLNAVFAIPNNLRKLMAEGALSSAFIPVFSEKLEKKEDAKSLGKSIVGFQFAVLVPVILAGIFFAEPFINLITDFSSQSHNELAVDLFRWIFSYVLLISISAIAMGMLNASFQFVIPAVTPFLFSVSVITSIILFSDDFGIYSMVIGVLTGGLLQVIFQVPSIKKRNLSLIPSFNFKDPAFKRVISLWMPVVGIAGIQIGLQFFAVYLASGMQDGSVTALQNSLVFYQLPLGIFSASLSTVYFSAMSKASANNDSDGVRQSLKKGLQGLFAFLIPSSLLLILMGQPVISVALQRGQFNWNDTLFTFQSLIGYAPGLFGIGAFSFLQRYFYAKGQRREPFVGVVLVAVIDIILSLLLKDQFGVQALGIANSVSFLCGALYLYWKISVQVGGFRTKGIVTYFIKVVLALIPGSLFAYVYPIIIGDYYSEGSNLLSILLLGGHGIVALGLIFGCYWLIKVDFIREALKR